MLEIAQLFNIYGGAVAILAVRLSLIVFDKDVPETSRRQGQEFQMFCRRHKGGTCVCRSIR